MQRKYDRFLSSADLRSSAIVARIAGAVFLLVGLTAGLLGLYDRFVAPLALREWFAGRDWLFLLGLLVGPVLLLIARSHARRVRSLRRIEAGGVPAWARVTRVRQAGERHGFRQVYYFRLQVQAAGGAGFASTAIDYLPISDAQLHAWPELYALWFPVLLDPQDRSSAKILWNDERVSWR